MISVAASIVSVHPRTLRIYEDEGLLCPARTATNIRLYSEEDVRRILWIRHLTQNRGVNLAGIRILFELEERLGTRILETLFDEANAFDDESPGSPRPKRPAGNPATANRGRATGPSPAGDPPAQRPPDTKPVPSRFVGAGGPREPDSVTNERRPQAVDKENQAMASKPSNPETKRRTKAQLTADAGQGRAEPSPLDQGRREPRPPPPKCDDQGRRKLRVASCPSSPCARPSSSPR